MTLQQMRSRRLLTAKSSCPMMVFGPCSTRERSSIFRTRLRWMRVVWGNGLWSAIWRRSGFCGMVCGWSPAQIWQPFLVHESMWFFLWQSLPKFQRGPGWFSIFKRFSSHRSNVFWHRIRSGQVITDYQKRIAGTTFWIVLNYFPKTLIRLTSS